MTLINGSLAFESLTRRQRQVLDLHAVNRVSLERIGATIGVSTAQARIELRQARLALCRRLSQDVRSAA